MSRRTPTPLGRIAGPSLPEQHEAVIQPLTALVARVEVVRELAARGEWAELINQLAAVRASAERLAAAASAAQELPDGPPRR